MVFRSTANRIADIVPHAQCYTDFGIDSVWDHPRLFADLAKLARVPLDHVELHSEQRSGSEYVILAVRCRRRDETVRYYSTDYAFPPSVLLAYLNAKLADAGREDQLVACRDGTDEVVALCDPDQQHELRDCIFAIVDDLRWPSAVVGDTERELLDAIRQTPTDDGPRLVYADWLTERGDRRGEFIALHCHADFEVRYRAQSILAVHEPTWVGHLPAWARNPVFERGFVQRITVTRDNAVRHRALFQAMTPVPELSIV